MERPKPSKNLQLLRPSMLRDTVKIDSCHQLDNDGSERVARSFGRIGEQKVQLVRASEKSPVGSPVLSAHQKPNQAGAIQ